MKNRPYYTVLVRFHHSAPWEVHFGSYSNDEAAEEQETIVHNREYGPSDTKVIKTAAAQSAINAKVAELNGGAAK